MVGPALAVVASLGLLYYVIRQTRIRDVVKRAFSWIILCSAVVNACDFLLQEETGGETWLNLITVRSIFIGLAAVFIGYLIMLLTRYTHVNSHRTFLREMKDEPYRIYIVYTIVVLASIAASLYTHYSIVEAAEGYGSIGFREEYFTRAGSWWMQTIGYLTAFTVIVFPIVHILVYIRVQQPSPKFIGNMVLILVGFIGAGVSYYLFTTLLLGAGVEIYGIRSIIDVLLLGVIAYSLREHRFLLAFNLQPEDTLDTESQYKLAPGVTYLVEEEKPEKSFNMFVDQVNHGVRGLCITRTNPDQIRLKYNLTKTTVLWLTDITTSRTDTVKPLLEDVSIVVHEFIGKGGDAVILLDGLEYLVSKNEDFNQVLQLIDRLKDSIAVHHSKMILPVSPATLGERDRALLERETEQV